MEVVFLSLSLSSKGSIKYLLCKSDNIAFFILQAYINTWQLHPVVVIIKFLSVSFILNKQLGIYLTIDCFNLKF